MQASITVLPVASCHRAMPSLRTHLRTTQARRAQTSVVPNRAPVTVAVTTSPAPMPAAATSRPGPRDRSGASSEKEDMRFSTPSASREPGPNCWRALPMAADGVRLPKHVSGSTPLSTIASPGPTVRRFAQHGGTEQAKYSEWPRPQTAIAVAAAYCASAK
jgi:hypothetical protein